MYKPCVGFLFLRYLCLVFFQQIYSFYGIMVNLLVREPKLFCDVDLLYYYMLTLQS